jgi:hypothetical protein
MSQLLAPPIQNRQNVPTYFSNTYLPSVETFACLFIIRTTKNIPKFPIAFQFFTGLPDFDFYWSKHTKTGKYTK